ncbi:MAG: Uma2 family endonuclease [Armatimonadetes bacterium]|nr:Uma2 family endonuclease [Armatimonadota bacterium]
MSLRRKALSDEDLYPADDGVPMDDDKHRRNANLLCDTLEKHLHERGVAAWASSNSFIYYEYGSPRKNVGPDFYVVVGASENPQRDCWRVWNEDYKLPQVIVEFVSKHSGHKDRVKNFKIYRDILKTPEYFIFDTRRGRASLEGWTLRGGEYVPLLPDAQGRLACDALGLRIGLQDGIVRWFDEHGALPTDAERATEKSRMAAEEARLRAEAEAEVARLRRLLEAKG